jgi:hypothetical protein
VADEWVHNADVITTDLDHELVLLNPTTRAVFTLNSTGRIVWQRLECPCTLDAAIAAVRDAFRVDEATARADVEKLLADLVAADLARRH